MPRLPFSTIGGILLLGSAVLTSAPAHSQSAPAGADASQDADEFFRNGKALYKVGKLQESYEAYRAAWRLKHTYDIAANLANTESQLGKTRDATEHLAFCIRNFPPTGSKSQLDPIKAQFDEARRVVGAINVKVNVDGAEVLIDGVFVGRAPLDNEVYVEPGTRMVEAKLSGYATAREPIEVAKGAARPATLTLLAVAPPRKALIATGGAVSGAGVVVGAVLAAISKGKASDASTKLDGLVKQRGPSACAQATAAGCQELHDLAVSKSTLGSAAAWTFIGAGAVGTATLIYGLAAPREPTRSGFVLVPVVTAQEGGLILRGVW